MKRRDKRKRRQKRALRMLAHKAPDRSDGGGGTVKVVRDSHNRQYIKAPDGSLRRVDKIDTSKLDWMSEV